ncbi:MAG: hypothetical protein LBB83_02925 [Treponema sp.]|nr:hypothetical protein [Treponema sp.]
MAVQAGFADNAAPIDAIRRRNEVKLTDELRNSGTRYKKPIFKGFILAEILDKYDIVM